MKSTINDEHSRDIIRAILLKIESNYEHESEISTMSPSTNYNIESKLVLSFVDPDIDPSHYVKRYINEEIYKDWFHENFPDYTIYEGIGITQEEYGDIVNELTKPEPEPEPEPEPKLTESLEQKQESELNIVLERINDAKRSLTKEQQKFAELASDPSKTWSTYRDILTDDKYIGSVYEFQSLKVKNYVQKLGDNRHAIWIEKNWNDDHYILMYYEGEKRFVGGDRVHGVGIVKSVNKQEISSPMGGGYPVLAPTIEGFVISAYDTSANNDIRNLTSDFELARSLGYEPIPSGGGCLIATAAFGSEMAPQVQFLRELRDNTVLQTTSGTTFMNGFNQFYYSFSPAVADYERENPVFKEIVKVTLTPLLTSLTLLNYVEIDTEEEMLGYGIGIILLNVGMYFVLPAAIILQVKRWKSKN